MATESVVDEILRKVLGQGVDLSTVRLGEDPAWDSLASLSILFELEERFDLELTDEEIAELTDRAAILAVLANRE